MDRDWIKRIDDYLDGNLSDEETHAFEVQLEIDQDLREEVVGMRAVRATLRQGKLHDVVESMKNLDASMDRNHEIVDWLDQDTGTMPGDWDEAMKKRATELYELVHGIEVSQRKRALGKVRGWDGALPEIAKAPLARHVRMGRRQWMGLAAGIAVLLAAVAFWPRQPWYEKLAQEHWVDFPDDGPKRGSTGLTDYQELRQQAGNYFNSGRYEEAIPYYEDLKELYSDRWGLADLYLGMIAYHRGDYVEAERLIEPFAFDEKIAEDYRERWAWLYWMSRLAQGEVEEVREGVDLELGNKLFERNN